MYNQNALLQFLMQQQPQNMLAQADQGFDPNGIVAKMLARQRAMEAAKQLQQNPPQAGQYQQPQPLPQGETAAQTLLRRMREQGLDQ